MQREGPLQMWRPGCETLPGFMLGGGSSLVSRRLSMWCCLSQCLQAVAPSLRGAQGCLSVGPSYWVALSVTASGSLKSRTTWSLLRPGMGTRPGARPAVSLMVQLTERRGHDKTAVASPELVPLLGDGYPQCPGGWARRGPRWLLPADRLMSCGPSLLPTHASVSPCGDPGRSFVARTCAAIGSREGDAWVKTEILLLVIHSFGLRV